MHPSSSCLNPAAGIIPPPPLSKVAKFEPDRIGADPRHEGARTGNYLRCDGVGNGAIVGIKVQEVG